MPRPCHLQHPPSPATCAYCAWAILPGDQADKLRAAWGEEKPIGAEVKFDFHQVDGSEKITSTVEGLAALKPLPATTRSSAIAGPTSTRSSPAKRFRPGDLLPGIADPLQADNPSTRPGDWAFQARVREQHCAALKTMLASQFPARKASGKRGIVYVGGARYWPMIVVGIRMARRYTDLPIEVWYSGATEPVRPDDISDLSNIALCSVQELGYPVAKVGGWENKTTALLHSQFDQVVYLDADAYLVGDPGPLLDAAASSRFAFWADLPWNNDTVGWDWSGVENSGRIPPIQGGQLGIDLIGFNRELIVSHWINQHSDYFYRHQYGDQDSWRIALAGTGGHHHVLGAAGWQPPAFVCRYPEPLVVHRCQAKLWDDTQVQFAHDLPEEGHVREYYNRQAIGKGDAAKVFGRVYEMGMWGQKGSSGDGSNDNESQPWTNLVSILTQLSGWSRLVDLASGDGRVTRRLVAPAITGVEVHAPHVQRLRKESPEIAWLEADIDRDRDQLPAGDVALLKDVLQHWPNDLVANWLDWAVACGKWSFILICGDCHHVVSGADCILGGYRPLDLCGANYSHLGIRPVTSYLHKGVYLLPCSARLGSTGGVVNQLSNGKSLQVSS